MCACMYACMHELPLWHVDVCLWVWVGGCLNKNRIAQFKFTTSGRSGGQTPNFEFRKKFIIHYRVWKNIWNWHMVIFLASKQIDQICSEFISRYDTEKEIDAIVCVKHFVHYIVEKIKSCKCFWKTGTYNSGHT